MLSFCLVFALLQGALGASLGSGSLNPLGQECYTVCTMSIPGTCYNPCTGSSWQTGLDLLPDLGVIPDTDLRPITKAVSADTMAAAARVLLPSINPGDPSCLGSVVCTMSIPGTCYNACTGETWTTGPSLEDLIGPLNPVAP